MVTKHIRNVSLSASATVNGWPMPVEAGPIMTGRGDFAGRHGGKVRRNERRAAIARKRAWLEG